MAEALKNRYNKTFIAALVSGVKDVYGDFDARSFTADIFDKHWDGRELKARMRHITQVLHRYLPGDYSKNIDILKPVAVNFSGFEPMFFPDYVEIYGLDDYAVSISALDHFTRYSSSEFAVRAFIKKYGTKMMSQMALWATSDNEHVRRLASEGSRPRLPWAMALAQFKKDPDPVLQIIEHLKTDDSLYVRRSVANNLNDISKDHPEFVIAIARKWLGQSAYTNWIIKHACRTLLKQGDIRALELFGYQVPQHIKLKQFSVSTNVKQGGILEFSFELLADEVELGKLRLEYAIDFVRANNRTSTKVFKIAEGDYKEKQKQIEKCHSFRKISTRRYYAGAHMLSIRINGREMARKTFMLVS